MRGRTGDPGMASRLAQLESQLRRLLGAARGAEPSGDLVECGEHLRGLQVEQGQSPGEALLELAEHPESAPISGRARTALARLFQDGAVSPLVDLAREAGASIMRVYENDVISVADKKDSSPLTEADLASHAVIVTGLHRLTPDIPVLSEEAADVAYAERSKWGRFWLVDPLDGTREFIDRTGEFTVNIALIDHHEPVLGVVYSPCAPDDDGDLIAWAEGCGPCGSPTGCTVTMPSRITPPRLKKSPKW